ncbi:TetR/AcrR family transcriptional regulator, partial [Streptomyces asiaticus]
MPKRVVPEEARRRRRPTRQGVVLSETLIVQAALRMLREHGSAGLTARRLGAALGADPSTLYRYFRGMDDLARAIGDELMGRALDRWTATGDWRADLRALGLALHSSE